MEFRAYDYQKTATNFILEKNKAGLFLDMGLGKTVSTLMAIEELIYQRLEIDKILVIAPLRVAKTVWDSEIEKWDRINHLKISKVLGTEKQRIDALNKKADIYIINRENVSWLIRNTNFDYDMVVIDELSSFKSTKAKRFRDLKKFIGRSKRVVGLTGTPSPNGLMDLWPQIFLLDKGERLGKTVTHYRSRYFKPGKSRGHIVYEYVPLPKAEKEIKNKLSDICLSMSKDDYLEMPDRVFIDVKVQMDSRERKLYKELERDNIIAFKDTEIVGVNAAALNNKLQQLANGAAYGDNQDVIKIHDKKLDALEELIEEANGQSVLVFYSYKHDRDRIKERLGSKCFELKSETAIKNWQEGKYEVAIAHPASVGHGLNLQSGGHIIVWFGLTWSLELYNQANDRLYRQGQKNTVSVYHLITEDTVDEACMRAIKKKEKGQEALMEYLKFKLDNFRKEE